MAIAKADVSFLSSKFGVAFSGEGAGTELLKRPDSTTLGIHLEKLQLCCASTVFVQFYDGSTGTKLAGLQCVSGAAVSQEWDFGNEPIITLNNDTTDSICVSVTGAGLYTGFLKGYSS